MVSAQDSLSELSKFIFKSRYAKYNPEQKRREEWGESVDRSLQMHLKKYENRLTKEQSDKIKWAFKLVEDMRVVPSMRSLQFGGKAIEAHNAKVFNCSVRHIDSIRAFSELFYLALNGCGTAFGVYNKFVSRLPSLVSAKNKNGIVHLYQIEDTIEGWADSIEVLLDCYTLGNPYTGRKISFDYSRIRAKGAPLKTTGGKAPGHEGLKAAHLKIKETLDRLIEKEGISRLRSVDVSDIMCHCMDAVLSGGIRRSAASIMFDWQDVLMWNYKVGEWYKENPQRARVNISALAIRSKISLQDFKEKSQFTRKFGEPGIVFGDDEDCLYNPCFEIGFVPVTKDGVCGVQFCNLSSINGAKIKSLAHFRECTEAATIIGTLQAGYTDYPYLSVAAKQLTEEEALLGVSITGMMDNPDVILNTDNQILMSNLAVQTNKKWAKILGVNQAARTTCIKPEGTSSLVLQSASGVHPHHARKYFRLVQMNKMDNVYKYFKKHNPHMIEESVWSANKTDDVIYFPIEVGPNAMVKDDLDAIKHLDIIKSTQINWVDNGTSHTNTKKVKHNVSCTVEVAAHEWDAVYEYLFENREYFTAVALLPRSDNDNTYAQSPLQRITKENEERYNFIAYEFKSVPYENLIENDDNTDMKAEAVCAGGQCDIQSFKPKQKD